MFIRLCFVTCLAVQLVAVPISTTSPAKMSPLKEHTILPKQVPYSLDKKIYSITMITRYPHYISIACNIYILHTIRNMSSDLIYDLYAALALSKS